MTTLSHKPDPTNPSVDRFQYPRWGWLGLACETNDHPSITKAAGRLFHSIAIPAKCSALPTAYALATTTRRDRASHTQLAILHVH